MTGLDQIAMLEGVTALQREVLVKVGRARSLTSGDVLIRQGEPAATMHFVLSGKLGIALGEPTADPIAVVSSGETVGELGVITGEPASAFVVAQESTELL